MLSCMAKMLIIYVNMRKTNLKFFLLVVKLELMYFYYYVLIRIMKRQTF